MIAEQIVLFPSVAEERLRSLEEIMKGFLDWHDGPMEWGDRKPVEWLAHQVREYFIEWGGE